MGGYQAVDDQLLPPTEDPPMPEVEENQPLISVNNADTESGDLKSLKLEKKRTATFFSSVVNLANTILGAGMLGLPYALSANGYVLGSIFLLLSGLASGFGLHVLVVCSDHCGEPSSYYVCAKKTYPNLAFVIDLVVFIKCFGVAISYLVVIGDLMPEVVYYFIGETESVLMSRQLWVAIFGVIIIPTAFLRQLNSLRFTSGLALLAVGYLVGLVISMFFVLEHTGENRPVIMDIHFFEVMTIYVFGFTCHQNIFSIYNELIDPTPVRINGVIITSIASALSVYLVVGNLGYLTFGDNVLSNIINNYPSDSIPVTVGRIFIVILVAFSYALQSHPDRICLDNLYKSVNSWWTARETGPQTNMRYYVETIAIVCGTFLIGFFVTDLGDVLAFVGAIGSTTMCYILPGVFLLKFEGLEKITITKVIAILMIAIGCFVMPTALVFVFYTPSG